MAPRRALAIPKAYSLASWCRVYGAGSCRASTWPQYHLAKFIEFCLDVRDPVVLSFAEVAQW